MSSKHWRSLFDKDEKFLGSWNLELNGKYNQVIVHIEKFYQDELIGSMGKEQKIACKLKEYPKGMVINRTNFKRLQTLFNSIDTEDFLNKPVLLQVEKVKSPEGLVDALRFSARPPVIKDAKPPIKDEDFPKALDALKSGAMTKEKLISTRTLSKEQLKQIDEI
jgi:hypothetical protein